MSLFDNVASGRRFNGIRRGSILDDAVDRSLFFTALWDSVSDRLKTVGSTLSNSEQQRLCIARDLAVEIETLLTDEPTSSLDPVSTRHIEELLTTLTQIVTIVIVTRNKLRASLTIAPCC